MSSFSIKPNNTKTNVDELNQIVKKLEDLETQCVGVGNNLGFSLSVVNNLKRALKRVAKDMKDESLSANEFSRRLQDVISLYENTELRIAGAAPKTKSINFRIDTVHINMILELIRRFLRWIIGWDNEESAYDGDPVNMCNGNYLDRITDISFTNGLKLSFTRYYNSIDFTYGCMGQGWKHNYEAKLFFVDDYLVVETDRGLERFIEENEGTYVSAYGGVDRVIKYEDEYRYNTGIISYVFNSDGKLKAIEDAQNNCINFEYRDDLLIKAVDQYDNYISYEYDNEGMLVNVTDSTERTLKFEYSDKMLTRAYDVLGNYKDYGYDEAGRLSQYICQDGSVDFTSYYDEDGRVIKQVFADESSMLYSYDGDCVTYTNETGHITKYYHDEKGRHCKTEYADGSVIEFGYNDNNKKILRIDRNGASFVRKFDVNANVAEVTNELGFTTKYLYDKVSMPSTTIFPDGTKTEADYDIVGNLIGITKASGRQIKYSYNKYGQIAEIIKGENKRCFEYDDKGNLIKDTNENGFSFLYEYDAYGYLKSYTDANGNKTEYEYLKNGKLLSVKNAEGNTRTYKYDQFGNTAEVTDFDGKCVKCEYDIRNRVSKRIDKMGNSTCFEYDDASHLKNVFLPNGGKISYKYDQMGRLIRKNLPDGECNEYKYDKNGDMIYVRYGEFVREYTYNAKHQIIGCSDNKGRKLNVEYDFRGQIVSVDSELGREKSCMYDADGNCTSVTDIMGRKIQYEYDENERLVGIIDASDRKITYKYDAAGMLELVKYPNGNWTKYNRDGNNNLIDKSQQNGYKLSYKYDSLNRPISIFDNQNHSIAMQYDALGNVIKKTDSKGNITSFLYNANNKLCKVTDAIGNVAKYTYDAMNRLTDIVIVPAGSTNQIKTHYERSAGGKIILVVNPLESSKKYEYDLNGNMVQMTDAYGNATKYFYDSAKRVNKIIFPDNKESKFEYDTTGNMTGVNDWNGNLRFEYDLVGRMIKSINALGETSTYEWGKANEIKRMIYPNGEIVDYEYDNLVRNVGIHSQLMDVKFEYDENGRLKTKSYGNSLEENYSYNLSGQLTSHGISFEGKVKENTIFEYDLMGNRTSKDTYDISGNLIKANRFKYDELNRLTDIIDNNDKYVTYEYDSMGNRMRMSDGNNETTYEYNVLNQMINKNILENGNIINKTEYQYDLNGNLISQTGDEESKEYVYDARGKLSKVSVNGATDINYTYDMLGHRISEEVVNNGISNTKNFRYDYSNVLQHIIGIDNNGKSKNYIWSTTLLGEFISDDEDARYYSCDELGSVIGVHNLQGETVEEYSYDAFGQIVSDNLGECEFGFTGYLKEMHGDYYANAREYMPEIGKFMSKDDDRYIHLRNVQSHNLYHYCMNNPVIFVDPSGNDCYIFYVPEWEDEALDNQRQLAEKYGCDPNEVHLIPLNEGQKTLEEGWNAMGYENGQQVDIDCVVINSHAGPDGLGLDDGGGSIFYASEISNLQHKDVESLVLYGCDSGHADYADNNCAAEFSKIVNGAPVIASDGTVGAYVGEDGVYRNCSEGDDFFKDLLINGDRDCKGWLVYQYENGKVKYTETGEYDLSLSEMYEIAKQHPAPSRRRSA